MSQAVVERSHSVTPVTPVTRVIPLRPVRPAAVEDPDPEARMRRVWDEHGDALTRYVAGLLGGDRHAAEDVTQEVMLRLWRHREAMTDMGSPRGWLFTVARRVVIDRHRRRSARPPEVSPEGPEPAAPDASDTVLDEMVVWEILRTVTPTHAMAVFLVHVRGLSVGQAAQVLGVPPGTVKSRCHYALRALRGSAMVSAGGRVA